MNKLEFTTDGMAKGLYIIKINGDNFTTAQNFIIN